MATLSPRPYATFAMDLLQQLQQWSSQKAHCTTSCWPWKCECLGLTAIPSNKLTCDICQKRRYRPTSRTQQRLGSNDLAGGHHVAAELCKNVPVSYTALLMSSSTSPTRLLTASQLYNNLACKLLRNSVALKQIQSAHQSLLKHNGTFRDFRPLDIQPQVFQIASFIDSFIEIQRQVLHIASFIENQTTMERIPGFWKGFLPWNLVCKPHFSHHFVALDSLQNLATHLFRRVVSWVHNLVPLQCFCLTSVVVNGDMMVMVRMGHWDSGA